MLKSIYKILVRITEGKASHRIDGQTGQNNVKTYIEVGLESVDGSNLFQ
jgi:hypothetical protein